MRAHAVALGVLLACAPRTPKVPMSTWPALDDPLLADAAATYNFKLGVPAPLAITADGAVLFRRTPARAFASDLFELSPTGTVRTLATAADLLGAAEEKLSNEEKARRERSRTATKGVVDLDVSDDGSTVMVPIGGQLVLIDRASGSRTSIDPGGAAYDPHLSPDGKHVAFVRDRALWMIGRSGAARQLTQPPEGHEDGVADFAAQEELGRRRGFWWSPDSTQIAFQRSDLRPVDSIYVSDPRHPDREPVKFKYPRAGTNNAIVSLGVVGLAGAAPVMFTWDAAVEYLADVTWTANAPLTAVVLDRDQDDVWVLAFDVATKRTTTLLTEHDDAWINVNVGTPKWLEDGSGFLWMTERPGAWVLEHRDRTGALVKQLTAPDFHLHHVGGVEKDAAIVLVTPVQTRQEVWRVPFDGSAPKRIDRHDGVANVMKAKHGVIAIDTQLAAGGRTVTALSATGERVLPSVAEQPKLVPTTVLETVQLGGRLHNVAITRPRSFDRSKKYPVLLKVYGGPHALTVLDARDTYVMDQWYADAGFIVVRSDNRGTPSRGREWERAILNDLITVPLEDQIGALHAVGARHAELDLSRVGIWGWSFGGYVSALAVLLRPDVFKAGVAGAPVTDWTLYDTAYTERYMKTPKANAAGYTSSSALTHAGKLTRPLLVIHGITDDNVHFAHTLAFIEALYIEGKRAEVITLSATHMVPDPKLNLARERVQIDFFRQHL
ncbi:MAG: DPP IV N-terminal domain-containing protein [Deltaproteobacteria bacterium]|nr:DPP IV N-terminal domain-containing protein [Deltaproteobacteria bacterium]